MIARAAIAPIVGSGSIEPSLPRSDLDDTDDGDLTSRGDRSDRPCIRLTTC